MPDNEESVSTWLSAIHKAIKEHTEAIEKYQQSESGHRQQQAQTETRAVVRLPVEVTEYYRSEQGERPVKSKHDKIRMILEIVGVIAALVIAALNLGSLLIFNGQLEEMRRANTDAAVETRTIRRHTREELRAVEQEAEAAQSQARTMNNQFESAERPYVGVDSISGQMNATTNTMNLSAQVKNFGLNPADDVKVYDKWYKNGVSVPRPPITEISGVLFPGIARSVPMYIVDADRFLSDAADLTVEMSVTYRWNKKHYKYCEQWKYRKSDPGRFATFGSCSTKRPN